MQGLLWWVLLVLEDSWCGLCVGCVVFFFVLCGFVLVCGILVLFLKHCIVYYGVTGLHYRVLVSRYFLGLLK